MSAGPVFAEVTGKDLPPGRPDAELQGLVSSIVGEGETATAAPALLAILSRSPYLAGIVLREGDWLGSALTKPLQEVAAEILDGVVAAGRDQGNNPLGLFLRRAKSRYALLVALAECGGAWSTAEATASLSRFADAALEAALNVLVREAVDRGEIEINSGSSVASQSGLMVFALGKLGGCELNFSSDIDIVTFYDVERARLTPRIEVGRFYQRLVRKLAALIGDRNAHGYVFRTDLRLRPDPSSTPVALSADAAMVYYESRGQNWERAAWIRARPAAGDLIAGADFLARLAPFIWRKHLDFATVADIRAMKRQISTRHGSTTRVPGHNVKLGAGGIREIEFFAQTQQLIAGGREPTLRTRPTERALMALSKAHMVVPEVAAELTENYWFFRAVENRLQMVADEQTHKMPEDEEAIADIAALMGCKEVAGFCHEYSRRADRTVEISNSLFHQNPDQNQSLASDLGDLVFTGADHDPATLETLARFGFGDPEAASAIVRGWQYGSYPATRTDRARQNLTELVPALLAALARSGDADGALKNFDVFVSKLPAGIQLFAMLRARTALIQIFVDLLVAAPRLTEAIGHKVHVVDGLIDSIYYGASQDKDELAARIDIFLAEATAYEDLMDRARIVGREQMFLVSAGLVAATLSPERAGPQFAAIAAILLDRLFAAAKTEFAKRHGQLEGASDGLLAFGKLASNEMTASSDLDFILLYDAPFDLEQSNGERPLAPGHYYTRLTQRLVAAISAPTGEGLLYETDMRLRPSGNKGPLATSLNAFVRYQQTEARTWEHMALARARVLDAGKGLAGDIAVSIDLILAQPRNRDKTLADIADMRTLIAKQKPPRSAFDLKRVAGGLIDLEFIAQAAQLLHRQNLKNPFAPPAHILKQLGGTAVLREGERLAEIHRTYTAILQLMNACLPNPVDRTSWTPGFRALLVRATNAAQFSALEADLEGMAAEVQTAFAKMMEG